MTAEELEKRGFVQKDANWHSHHSYDPGATPWEITEYRLKAAVKGSKKMIELMESRSFLSEWPEDCDKMEWALNSLKTFLGEK